MKLSTSDYVDLFKSEYQPEFFLSANSSYLSVLINTKNSTFKIDSKQMNDLLRMCFRKNKINVSKFQMKEIVGELDSLAFESQTYKNVFIRNGYGSNNIYFIDTCNNGKFIKIEAGKWSIEDNCTLPFYRPSKQVALPLPQQTTLDIFIKKFKDKWNLIHPDNYILILAAIINALKSDSESFIIMIFEGEQGQGKTTASKNVKRLIDPTFPLLNVFPDTIENFNAMISSSYFLAIDNTSFVKKKMADLLCSISTGGGFTLRELYTTNDEATFDVLRPMLVNGINGATNQPDALDRMVINECGGLINSSRKSDSFLEQEFTDDYPILLGGLYSLFAEVIKILPTITHTNLPRMANYARIGIAIEQILQLKSGFFLETYSKNIKGKSENAFWEDELCSYIFETLEGRSTNVGDNRNIEGTSSKILQNIRRVNKSFSPNGHFGNHLNRVKPLLRDRGIIVERLQRTSRSRLIRIRFTDAMLKEVLSLNSDESDYASNLSDINGDSHDQEIEEIEEDYL